MFWIWYVVILIADIFIQKALTPKASAPQPQAAGTIETPTADATRIIPIAFGTCKVTGLNLLWFGCKDAVPHVVSTGSTTTAIAGYSYRASMDLGVCHGPVDYVKQIMINEKRIFYDVTFSPSSDPVSRSALDLSAFYSQTCGLYGNVEIYRGVVDQSTSEHLQVYASADYPGNSGLCHVVFERTVWGEGTYVPPVSVVVRNCPNTLGLSANHHIIPAESVTTLLYNNPDTHEPVTYERTHEDANPACILYEILTNTTWGLGLSASLIDLASFRAVGDALYVEGFGLSMVYDAPAAATDMIREVLRYIDGGLTTHPTTGLLMLKLIRQDYTISALSVLDESCIDGMELSRKSWCETVNTVRINYTSWADNFTPRVAQWQNLANLQVAGVPTSLEVDYLGCTNGYTAGVVAARMMKLSSYPFAALRFKVNRKAWSLRQCDVFVLNWPPLGISGMVCRVTRPATGLLEDGMMTIECVEDAFALANTAYSNNGGSQWSDPGIYPDPIPIEPPVIPPGGSPIVMAALWEPPLLLTHLASGGYGCGDLWALATHPVSPLVLGMEIWSDPAGGTNFTRTGGSTGFTPGGTLKNAYGEKTDYVDATGLVVTNISGGAYVSNVWDIDACKTDASRQITFRNQAFMGLILVDNEIMGYTGISGVGTDRTLTGIWRGMFDTVPAAHAASAIVWFVYNGNVKTKVADNTWYALTPTINVKMLPRTASGVGALADATAISATITQRAKLMLPPGNMKINSTTWPTSIAHGADIIVTWARRDGFGEIYTQDAWGQGDRDCTAVMGGMDSYMEQNYTIHVLVGGVVKTTATGLCPGTAATTWAWTAAQQAIDCASVYNKTVAIRVQAYDWHSLNTGPYQERTFTIT